MGNVTDVFIDSGRYMPVIYTAVGHYCLLLCTTTATATSFSSLSSAKHQGMGLLSSSFFQSLLSFPHVLYTSKRKSPEDLRRDDPNNLSLKCHNNIRHFLRRFTHNSHPLRCNLARRGTKIDIKCPVCQRIGEYGGHLFFKCSLAKHVWEQLDLEGLRQRLADQSSARDVVAMLLKGKEQIRTTAVITLWFLWTNRNATREEGRGRTDVKITRGIRSYCQELYQPQETTNIQRSMEKVKWCKPPEGVLKLNCDASFRAAEGSGSWGFLIRDHDGDVILSGRGKLNHVFSAFQVELISCIQGVQAAINLGIVCLILETDALMVKQAMSSDAYDSMVEGSLVEKLRFLASMNFSFFECKHLSRVGNRAANAYLTLNFRYLWPN